jgi:hypothetical protein
VCNAGYFEAGAGCCEDQTANNKVLAGGFNTQDAATSNWTIADSSLVKWASDQDASSCATGGGAMAMYVDSNELSSTFSQCVDLPRNTDVNVGFRYKAMADFQLQCGLVVIASPCGQNSGQLQWIPNQGLVGPTTWDNVTTSFTTYDQPSNSVQITCSVVLTPDVSSTTLAGYIDRFYVNASGGTF